MRILSGAPFSLKMPKNALKMVFLAFSSISKRRDRCYGRFGTFWGPKNLFLMPKNTKKRIWIFCLFLRVEMTSQHKNSSKTLSNTPKMVQNYIKGVNIYIGRPSKKKTQKIWTQGKSCFFTVNATIYIHSSFSVLSTSSVIYIYIYNDGQNGCCLGN